MAKPGRGSGRRPAADTPAAESLDRLAEDWITLWQTELAGLAADPDWIALSQHSMAVGAAWLRMVAATVTPPAARDDSTRSTARDDRAAEAATRPAPAAPAPGDGDAPGPGVAGDRGSGDAGPDTETALRRRLAELEQRLAALERGPRRGRSDRPSPRRRRPSA